MAGDPDPVRWAAPRQLPSETAITPRILVIDPNVEVHEFVRAALEETGMVVFCTRTAAEARAVLSQEAVDLSLIEVMLPDVPGDQLAIEIAKSGAVPVLMSGHPDGVTRAGATGYTLLRKPFRAKQLLRAAILRLPHP